MPKYKAFDRKKSDKKLHAEALDFAEDNSWVVEIEDYSDVNFASGDSFYRNPQDVAIFRPTKAGNWRHVETIIIDARRPLSDKSTFKAFNCRNGRDYICR